VSTLAILADIIDTWNTNGNRLVTFFRVVGFPLILAAVAVMAYAKSRSAGAVIGVLIVGAIAAVMVYRPEALNELASLAGF
jgi:amino acid permease